MDYSVFSGLSEAYEVVRTVQTVTAASRTYRVEIVQDLLATEPVFKANCYQKRRIYTRTEQEHEEQLGIDVWVMASMPWVNRDTAESALGQTLGFISDQARIGAL